MTLKVGSRIRLESGWYEVELVNACRARIKSEAVISREFTTADGKTVKLGSRRTLDVSPNTIPLEVKG